MTWRKIFISFIGVILIGLALNKFVLHLVGADADTQFKIGDCVRDDEMGVSYAINEISKGSMGLKIVASDKYPSSEFYKLGTTLRFPLEKNHEKLISIQCP